MKIPFINSYLYINNKYLNILLFYVINMTFMKYIRYVNSYSAKNNHKLLASSNNLILPKLNNLNNQYIITNKNNHIFGVNDKDKFLNENEFIKDKKIISISPGGYMGLYMFGTCTYIKEHFNLDNYIFSGASAGAWNSLIMCCKKDTNILQKFIIERCVKETNNIIELENRMKNQILATYTIDDFDLKRLFVGVTTFKGIFPITTIFSGFNSLEDAIDCIIASSHIPFVTGGLINKYNNTLTFDGGFLREPYLNINERILHITPKMWIKQKPNNNIIKDIQDYASMFSKDKYDFAKLYEEGYNDAHKNRDFLNSIFGTNDDTLFIHNLLQNHIM